jgi:hypothetical protein
MRNTTVTIAIAVAMVACTPERQAWSDTFNGDGEDAFLIDDDFVCLADEQVSRVGHTNLWNVLGHDDEMVAVAEAGTGTWPVGTVVQLFASEAMVKRGVGFSRASQDWEFLKIDAGSGRTVITERGTDAISNPAGSCLGCHAASTHDYVCFTNDGCAPLPGFINTDVDPATDDPRCQR